MKKNTKIKLLKRKGFVNDRMIKFAKLYAFNGNPSRSYIDAGYECKKSSSYTASIRLLRNVHIQELVRNERSRIVERYDIDSESILNQLKVIAYSDIRDYLKFDGKHIKLEKLDHIDTVLSKAIKSYRMTISRTGRIVINLELHDKIDALVKLGEYADLWKARDAGEREMKVTLLDARKAG